MEDPVACSFAVTQSAAGSAGALARIERKARKASLKRSLVKKTWRLRPTAGEGARVPSMKNRRVVIVGFMGCGKTTVAKTLARQLGCTMIDLDSFITEREGRSPAEIIAQDGESSFRSIETRALGDVLENNDPRVIALGGGAWTIEANRALIAQHDCLSVWLDAPFELCWARITANPKTIRPLAPNRETAQKLHQSRQVSYLLAQQRVDATKGLSEIVSEITRGLV
jgi:shikimate kinase